jgi:hypothetical protein
VPLLILAAVSGAYVSGLLLAALLLHEAGHLFVLGKRRANPGLLFFLPYVGLLKAEARDEFPLMDRASILLAGPLVGLLTGVILLWANTLWPTHYLQDAASVFIALNALLLVPYIGTDGFRVLASISAPGSMIRPVIQLVSVVALFVVGIAAKSQFSNSLGFMLAVWFVAQLPTFNLVRTIVRQIPRDSDWHGAVHAAFVAMTAPRFARWGAPIRQMRAIGIANDLTRPANSREKALTLVGYGCCALLAVCAALQASL